MANSLVPFSILAGYGFNKLRERIERLKCICVYCCLAIYIYFVLNSAQSSSKKVIGNVTVKNYLKKSWCLFCASLFKERFFRKGSDPEFSFVACGN